MTRDEHDEAGTLAGIALAEAAVNDDSHAWHVLLEGVLGDGHAPEVIGMLASLLAGELTGHHGKDGALEMLAHHRGHALGAHQCEPAAPGELPTVPEAITDVAAEVSTIADKAGTIGDSLGDIGSTMAENTDELRALTRAVERLGDILDKRLS